MTARALPPVELLRERLSYDPATGGLTWKYRSDAIKMWNTRYAGKPAGSQSRDGYIYVAIDTVDFVAHRLIFKMMTGEDPTDEVDHRNGRRNDNRWGNLRAATINQNRRNQRPKNRGGRLPKGVYFHKARRRFAAQIKHNSRVIYLGLHDTPEAAHAAYAAASTRYHGAFGRVA